MQSYALPLWLSHGIDRKLYAAYPELQLLKLNGKHSLQADEASGWVGQSQAQLVYIISQARHLGWVEDEAYLVEQMIAFSGRHGVLPCRSDGFVRRLHPDLSVAEADRLVLDHAYFMMASTASFVAYGVGNDLRRAYNIMHWIDIKMSHEDGGWCQAYQLPKAANSESYLHLLEAFLLLFEVTRKPIWLERAEVVYDIFMERFLDPEQYVVFAEVAEYAGENQQTLAPPCQLFFWVWLLRRYQHHAGSAAGSLIEGICNQLYKKGRDYINATAPHHTSLLLSSFVLASSYQVQVGKENSEPDLKTAVEQLRHYALLNPIRGWCADKEPSTTFTATRFYYLFEAVREAYLYLHPQEREVPLQEVGGL